MSKKKDSLFINIFDIFFIMVLCFATLYTALLIQDPNSMVQYDFKAVTLAATMFGLVGLLSYIIIQSEKQLRRAFKQFYKDNE